MLKINLEKIAPTLAKVRKTPNKTLARTHYINFLKEEDKFMSSSEKLSQRIDDLSLKVIPQFFTSLKHFALMGAERLKSAYYFKK
jgi:hypothetical protein